MSDNFFKVFNQQSSKESVITRTREKKQIRRR